MRAPSNAPAAATKPSAAAPGEGVSAQEQYDFGGVDRLLDRAVPRIGSGALLVVKDGRVIYRRAFGRGSEERVVPVASASKWLSAAVIMTLVDEGKLGLDDPVSKYLPSFSGDKAAITIRQLFSHTSGLPPEARCRNDKATTLERCAEEMAGLRLRATPGAEFHYGGVSMHVGGRVAEVVSGKAWNDLFLEKIAAPLGMTRTDYFSYGATRNPRPEGDARSSVDDYGRFLQMLLNRGEFNGRRVLSEAAVAEMHKDQTGGARIAYTIYEKHGDLNPELLRARYGLGVWREVVEAETGELLEASSQGALGFSPWIDLERNLGGVLLVQSSFSKVMPVYLELKREIRRVVPRD
ncbi:MAG TPA: serine hydrolase domain-containing protein [Pyrinomonadaceae bacterium]|nr:serine hydrolase domain-containing protein [Pyrinomonadaceae bacterium]